MVKEHILNYSLQSDMTTNGNKSLPSALFGCGHEVKMRHGFIRCCSMAFCNPKLDWL